MYVFTRKSDSNQTGGATTRSNRTKPSRSTKSTLRSRYAYYRRKLHALTEMLKKKSVKTRNRFVRRLSIKFPNASIDLKDSPTIAVNKALDSNQASTRRRRKGFASQLSNMNIVLITIAGILAAIGVGMGTGIGLWLKQLSQKLSSSPIVLLSTTTTSPSAASSAPPDPPIPPQATRPKPKLNPNALAGVKRKGSVNRPSPAKQDTEDPFVKELKQATEKHRLGSFLNNTKSLKKHSPQQAPKTAKEALHADKKHKQKDVMQQYKNMQKIKLPEGAIRHKMASDGISDKDIDRFFQENSGK